MPREGVTRAYRFYADRFYADRANRDTYLARNAAGDWVISGNLVLPALKAVDGVDVSAHAADLAAHSYNFAQKVITGQYWHSLGCLTPEAAMTAAYLYAIPLPIGRAMTIDRIALQVTTAGAADKKARLGIYNEGTNLYPGTLLLDAGEVDVASLGIKAIVISQALAKGLYWIAVISDGAPNITGAAPAFAASIMGVDYSYHLYIGNSGWKVSQAYGALPDPFTADGTVPYNVVTPGGAVRILSLD